jgi:arylsulfatase
MFYNFYMKTSIVALGLPLLSISAGMFGNERPNIILILSDDMGYSDLSCYGGSIETPNLDSIANNGLQYMQFYNSARSVPSRASLMTGLHPHQAGVGRMLNNLGLEGYRGDLSSKSVTIAEVLKGSGYETFALGKWHMTRFEGANSPKHNWPLQRGFDQFYGTISGAGSFYDPSQLCRGNTYITPENDIEYQPDKFYYTNAITDNAIKFLDDRENSQAPFFMYVAYTAAHWPMHALEEDYEPYIGKFDEGWDKLRSERYQKMIDAGLIDSSWKLGVDPTVPSWNSLSAEEKAFELRCMEVYAGMVSNMDKNIGRLISYLESKGELENTMIIFLQDNGGCAENYGRDHKYPYTVQVPAGEKLSPMRIDELQDYVIPYRTRDGKPIRCGLGTMAGPADTYLSYGKGWAHLSNTPFVEYKRWTHEGGISTPLLIQYPKMITSNKGEKRFQPGQLTDIMATILDVTSAEYPKTYRGEDVIPYEGKSLVPSFEQDNFDYDRELFFEHLGNRAIRSGKWKLVYKAGSGSTKEINLSSWELYDLETDRGETNNLAASYPDVVSELAVKWNDFADRCNVRPWPGSVSLPDDKIYKIIDFENGFPGKWGTNGNGNGLSENDDSFQIVDNPFKDVLNSSDKVAKFKRSVNGEWWAYAWFDFDWTIMDTQPKYLHVMVNKPVVSPVCVQLKDRHANTSSNSGEIIMSTQSKINQWEDLVFKINKIGDYCYFEFKPDFFNSTLNSRLINDIDIYFDNIVINNDPNPRGNVLDDDKVGFWLNEDFTSVSWMSLIHDLKGLPTNTPGYISVGTTTPDTIASPNGLNLIFDNCEYFKFNSVQDGYGLPTSDGDGLYDYVLRLFYNYDAQTSIELPELMDVGKVTMHTRNRNGTTSTKAILQKYENNNWVSLDTIIIPPYTNPQMQKTDTVMSFSYRSSLPTKLRVTKDKAENRYVNFYKLKVEKYDNSTSDVERGMYYDDISIAIFGRTIHVYGMKNHFDFSLFDVAGNEVFQIKNIQQHVMLPENVEKGVYVAKLSDNTGNYIKKMYLP